MMSLSSKAIKNALKMLTTLNKVTYFSPYLGIKPAIGANQCIIHIESSKSK